MQHSPQSTKPHYYRKRKKCGKVPCATCREYGGHGPYWFESHTNSETGKTIETYIGLRLPDEVQLQVAIGRTHQSELVGRENELREVQSLLNLFDRPAKQRKTRATPLTPRKQFVIFQGEVGIGKTRLAEEAARLALQQGWGVAWGRAYASERGVPYRIWGEILRALLHQAHWSHQDIPHFEQYVPALASLLPDLPEIQARALPVELLPSAGREELWEAAYRMLVASSTKQPLLIVLDDLQWADSASCNLLAYLVHRIHDHLPVLFLGTCREQELEANHPLHALLADLEREESVLMCSVLPLEAKDLRELLSNLPTAIAETICVRAAGNPFFAEELARSFPPVLPLSDWSVLRPYGDSTQEPLPASITTLLKNRLHKLSPTCLRILERGAALGNTFSYTLLSALQQATSPGDASLSGESPSLTLDESIDEAVRSGVLTEVRTGPGQQITYHFWHPLFAEMLYEQISETLRARYHREIAAILQERKEQDAAVVLHHLLRGNGELSAIAHYAELAGTHAYALASYPEAEHYYGIALEHVRSLPTETNRDREALLLQLLAEVARLQGKYEQALGWYEQALTTLKHQAFSGGEQRQAAQIQALLWVEIGSTWYSRGSMDQAQQAYRESETLLQDVGIAVGPAVAYLRYRQSYVCWRQGKYHEALALANKAENLQGDDFSHQSVAAPSSSPLTLIQRTLAGDPVQPARIHQLLGLIYNGMGDTQKTIEHWKAARITFELHDSKRDLAVIACNLGDVYLRKADYSEARATLEQALLLAEYIGEVPLSGVILGNLGIGALRQGSLAEAASWLRKGVRCAEQAQNAIHRCVLHAYLARVLLEQKQFKEARASVCAALSIRGMHILPSVAVALVALADLRLTLAQANARQKKAASPSSGAQKKLLRRAARTLRFVLQLNRVEAETRIEARLLLAQVTAILGEAGARQLAEHVLEEAHAYGLTWLIARAERILGSIQTAEGQREQAAEHYQRALQLMQSTGMRLDQSGTQKEYEQLLASLLQAKKNP